MLVTFGMTWAPCGCAKQRRKNDASAGIRTSCPSDVQVLASPYLYPYTTSFESKVGPCAHSILFFLIRSEIGMVAWWQLCVWSFSFIQWQYVFKFPIDKRYVLSGFTKLYDQALETNDRILFRWPTLHKFDGGSSDT
jgi:hypothetical protein